MTALYVLGLPFTFRWSWANCTDLDTGERAWGEVAGFTLLWPIMLAGMAGLAVYKWRMK